MNTLSWNLSETGYSCCSPHPFTTLKMKWPLSILTVCRWGGEIEEAILTQLDDNDLFYVSVVLPPPPCPQPCILLLAWSYAGLLLGRIHWVGSRGAFSQTGVPGIMAHEVSSMLVWIGWFCQAVIVRLLPWGLGWCLSVGSAGGFAVQQTGLRDHLSGIIELPGNMHCSVVGQLQDPNYGVWAASWLLGTQTLLMDWLYQWDMARVLLSPLPSPLLNRLRIWQTSHWQCWHGI